MSDLDAIAVSSGPGSYTGLRIGISAAKGFCYAMNKPLIGIETLKALAWSIQNSQVPNHRRLVSFTTDPQSYFCPMIDARRMEVYCAVYDDKLNEIEKVTAKIIDEHSFNDLLTDRKIYFFGDGAAKCKPLFSKNENAIFIEPVFLSAVSMVALAEEKFNGKEFEDAALFEPVYLKRIELPK